VRLSGLTLHHFRNLGSQDLEFPPEGVALIGDNAQGKSNFLEAIYYLETFRSFRGARDEQLVGFDNELFRVTGTMQATDEECGTEVVTAAFERNGKRKKVSVNGDEPERLGDALGRLAAVVFSPRDTQLVSGGPKERRRFLDIILSLSQPGYLAAIQDYRKTLHQRNVSLKSGQPPSVVMAWDSGLVKLGASVIQARREWLNLRCEAFSDYYARVSGGVTARITYAPSLSLTGVASEQGIAEAFRDALSVTAERERRVGATVVGPHRDDIQLQLDNGGSPLDLRQYGSGGQRRTAALALRLVEAKSIRESRCKQPLVLLDDVFAEFDSGRSERVLELMEAEETGQVVLTAPREEQVRIHSDSLPRWRIKAGVVTT
jgi:DNA replication and repair protein RecF|tara:strand:- start:1054 stop:2178 length:1125 start_codon:yes stop_codon:yes gene_type:complete